MSRRSSFTVMGVAAVVAAAAIGTAVTAQAAPRAVKAPAVTCAGAQWSPTAAYTGGDVVTRGGRAWTAKGRSYGDVPGRNGTDVWADGGACADPRPGPRPPAPPWHPTPSTGDRKVVGYFVEWGVYGRNYHVKNIQTSGAADRLTHLVYAFGNVTGGRCAVGDSSADYDKEYSAADSVDGVADTGDTGALRGSFGQLRRLKKLHPGLKVLWSFGGWTWSGGFSQAVQDPTGFADSCYDLLKDPRWADVFDGIDIDWEYPNACGVTCDTSGRSGYTRLMAALRSRFGKGALVTSAISGDGTNGGKLEAADYAGASTYVDWYMAMTYDYAGSSSPQGPTAPHSPLRSYPGQAIRGFDSATAVAELKALGVPAGKILLGIGFYGRGWTGVTQDAAGGTASGLAPGTYESGVEDYKVLKTRCPATGTVGGTGYGHCGSEWWSYDTPQTIARKMEYAKRQRLGGAFFWELSGDTADGELVKVIATHLD